MAAHTSVALGILAHVKDSSIVCTVNILLHPVYHGQ